MATSENIVRREEPEPPRNGVEGRGLSVWDGHVSVMPRCGSERVRGVEREGGEGPLQRYKRHLSCQDANRD
jgi:hypothetical protein